MKYYLVFLYKVDYRKAYKGQAVTIGHVIVKKGLNKATELLTGEKLEIIPKKATNEHGVIDERYHNKEKFKETGYHLVLLQEDFTEKNIATKEDIDEYVDYFDCNTYKKIYDRINERKQAQVKKSQTIRQKIKAVKGTRK